MLHRLYFPTGLASIALLISAVIAPSGVQAQLSQQCETDGSYEPAAETTRTVELPDFGISIEIPENYRAMKLQDGAVQILHPDDFEWLQCIARGGTGAHGYYSETIEQVEPDPAMSLREQAIWSVGYATNPDGSRSPAVTDVVPYQHSGLNGYVVSSMSGYSAVFLGTSPDSDQLLRVSASCDCEVEAEAVTDLLAGIKPLD
ncbi:MAG: hypothetical protein ACTS2F_19765 [Thainema sp.]